MKNNYFMGIALNRNWFFSEKFGSSIGIEEPEPEIVFKKAREITNIILKEARNSKKRNNKTNIKGLVQFGGESMLFYEDPDLYDEIRALTEDYSNEMEPVYPFIHVQNDAWPEKATSFPIIKKNLERAKYFKDEAVVVHLNVSDKTNENNILEKTIEAMTSNKFIEMVDEYRIRICFENNHHMSYFGYPENIIHLYELLEEKLIKLDKTHLIPYYNFCFDIGHFFTQMHKSGRDVEKELLKFYDNFGDKIGAFHLHTNSGAWDDHIIPIEYNKLLAPNSEKYNPELSDKHTKILWKTLKYWANITRESTKPRWFIFEIDVQYNLEQMAELGKRMANALLNV